MLNTMDVALPANIQAEVDQEIAKWNDAGNTRRLWEKDASLWTDGDESSWLDWLGIVEKETGRKGLYLDLTADIKNAGYTDVLLMGMGGSSLCPEVLAKAFERRNFYILDSTVPAQVKAVENKLDLERTLFVVASKSGSTLEPNCFKQYFFDLVSSSVGKANAGRQFLAITDPGSNLEAVAKEDGFRHIIYGEPGIGGRFSALSAFGLTAAAAMGLDVGEFLNKTNPMVEACRIETASKNPGVLLGILLGVCHRHKRDKLTIITSPSIRGLGAWLEQLVAESTGKNGVAIIPVDDEPAEGTFSDDRFFAFLDLGDARSDSSIFDEITANGHPAIRINIGGVGSLGQEFFRWEIATAVAGSIMGINPFDQPDVEAAKVEARKITDEYERTGSLPPEFPFISDGNLSLFINSDQIANLTNNRDHPTLKDVLDRHLKQLSQYDYFALLAYVEMSEQMIGLLTTLRKRVLEKYGNATCLGFGPRFLHSTGQAYKGGPNNGVFLQITADDPLDLEVPGQKYTFGVVKTAQARGDFQVLLDRNRRALRVHIKGDVTLGIKRLTDSV